MVWFFGFSCSSRVPLCATPWAVTRQAPLSMGFSRQEYWTELPCPSSESLTPEELEGIQLNVVIAQTPDSGTYYIQSEGKVVTLTYYE